MGRNTRVKADGKLLIAGAFQEAGEEKRFGVINPANQAVVGQRALRTEEDAKQDVEAAREAQEDSDRMGVPRRA